MASQMSMMLFLRNLALIGARLMLANVPGWRYGLDRRVE